MPTFVISYQGNRFEVPRPYVPRFEALGIENRIEITKQQFGGCLSLFNQIRFELGLLPNQRKIVQLF